MSKKTIIIVLSAILSIFVITMIVVIAAKKSNTPIKEDVTEHKYAVNKTEDATTQEQSTTENTQQLNTKYNNMDKLNKEQSADEETFIDLVYNYSKKEATKDLDYVEVSASSNEEQVYATLYYKDGNTDQVVVLYDMYSKHSFMSCMSVEEWNSIQNGDNAG